jgi:hypothetical protein
MKIRTGRKNRRNLYLQLGDEPGNSDPCLGLMIDPEVAVILSSVVSPDDAGLIGFALSRKDKP